MKGSLSIIFLFSILLLKAQSGLRIHPYPSDTNITRIYPKLALNFGVTRDDEESNIQLCIYVDSLKKNDYAVVLTVFFPIEMNPISTQLEIGFRNAGLEFFKPCYMDSEAGYTEYSVSEEQYNLLKEGQYEYVNFMINGYSIPYGEDWVADDFFSSFLKAL